MKSQADQSTPWTTLSVQGKSKPCEAEERGWYRVQHLFNGGLIWPWRDIKAGFYSSFLMLSQIWLAIKTVFIRVYWYVELLPLQMAWRESKWQQAWALSPARSMGIEKPSKSLSWRAFCMSEWYHHHIPATPSIAYSVVYMQAKPVGFEGINRVGSRRLMSPKSVTFSCCRRCGWAGHGACGHSRERRGRPHHRSCQELYSLRQPLLRYRRFVPIT